MVEESLRQKVFSFMDNNPEAIPKDVYKEFPNDSENSLRTYRNQFLDEKEKLIYQVKVADKNNEKKIGPGILKKSENILSLEKLDKFSINHFFELFHTFSCLPLFIYSKTHSIALNKFGLNKRNHSSTTKNTKEWSLSFYDLYMEIIDDICLEKYDSEITSYEGNALQLFGNTISHEMFDMDFKKELLEKKSYWTEKQFEDRMKEIKEIIEDPNHEYHKYYTQSYEYYYKDNREQVEEGYCMANYEHEKEYIEGLMKECFEQIDSWRVEYPNPGTKSFKSLRSKLLYYIFWDLHEHNEFICRYPEISKEDIRKIVIEYNINNPDKKSFVEDVKKYNSSAIGHDMDTMTVTIDREGYIDLGQHGKEYLGTQILYDRENGEWIEREYYFDNVKFEE